MNTAAYLIVIVLIASAFYLGLMAAMREAIQKVQGVEVLSAPRVITTAGASAAIAIGDTSRPGGAIRLDFIPKLAADGRGLDLQMDLQLPSGPAR